MKTVDRARWLLLLGVLVVGAAAAQQTAPVPDTPGGIEVSAQESAVEPPVVAENGQAKASAEPPPVDGVGVRKEEEELPPKVLPPDEELPVAKLIADLTNWRFWITLLVALICGGLGGVVYELLILQGNIEIPHPAKDDEASEPFPYALSRNLVDFGVWARVIIGGLAAVAAIWLLRPTTGLGLVAGAIIAGSAGTSVFRSLQDRLLATLAQKDAAAVRSTAHLQTEKVNQALALVQAARATGVPAAGAAPAVAGAAAIPGTPDLRAAERLLTEAQAIGETLQSKHPNK